MVAAIAMGGDAPMRTAIATFRYSHGAFRYMSSPWHSPSYIFAGTIEALVAEVAALASI